MNSVGIFGGRFVWKANEGTSDHVQNDLLLDNPSPTLPKLGEGKQLQWFHQCHPKSTASIEFT
ncbi:hypothetical protein C0431_05115 [bacterium]|nr:hypothetical protein [bacterium]